MGSNHPPTHGKHYMACTLKCECAECLLYKTLRNRSRRKNKDKPINKGLVHGTYGGYKRELQLKMDPCDKCKDANNDYMRRFRLRSKLL